MSEAASIRDKYGENAGGIFAEIASPESQPAELSPSEESQPEESPDEPASNGGAVAGGEASSEDCSSSSSAQEYVHYLLHSGKLEIKLLIIGHVGYGKSALVNTLFGTDIAEERDSASSVTKTVGYHTRTIEGIKISIADTPGFFAVQQQKKENSTAGNHQESILKDVRKMFGEADLVIVCIKMTGRFSSFEEELIKIVKEEYGVEVLLKHTVFALTFANRVEAPRRSTTSLEDHFARKLQEMKEEVHSIIRNFADPKEVACIPVMPVGYSDSRCLPTVQDWFVSFWYTCYKRTSDETKAAFSALGIEQITSSRSTSSGSFPLSQGDASRIQEEVRSDNERSGSSFFLLRIIDRLIKLFFRD